MAEAGKDEALERAAGEDVYVTGSSAPLMRERSLEQAIGVQVRALRTRRGLKSTDLAAAAGISGSLMSKIENGQVSPSLATLQALAAALNVPIALLFATVEETRDCSYVRAAEGVVIERRGTKAGHQDPAARPFALRRRGGGADLISCHGRRSPTPRSSMPASN